MGDTGDMTSRDTGDKAPGDTGDKAPGDTGDMAPGVIGDTTSRDTGHKASGDKTKVVQTWPANIPNTRMFGKVMELSHFYYGNSLSIRCYLKYMLCDLPTTGFTLTQRSVP